MLYGLRRHGPRAPLLALCEGLHRPEARRLAQYQCCGLESGEPRMVATVRGALGFLLKAGFNCAHRLQKLGQAHVYSVPNDFICNAPIIVAKNITDSGDVTPRDLLMLLLNFCEGSVAKLPILPLDIARRRVAFSRPARIVRTSGLP